MQIIKYNFQRHGDTRGDLVVLEEFKEVPFQIKRVYYMFNTKKEVTRGLHSHKKLEQILICIHGKCKIRLDDGRERKEVTLDNPFMGVYVGPNTWREMYDFEEDTVLMCLASELYDEADYIRDYEEFLIERKRED